MLLLLLMEVRVVVLVSLLRMLGRERRCSLRLLGLKGVYSRVHLLLELVLLLLSAMDVFIVSYPSRA